MMTNVDQATLQAVLRNNNASFVHRCFQTVVPGATFSLNWHILAIAYHLHLCRLRQITRLIITVPPRSGKSISASVAFPAFLLGHDPTCRIINVSYSTELAYEFARQFRMVVGSHWYRHVFPEMQAQKDAEAEFVTTRGGSRYSTSVGGTLTGRGADFLIIDDPTKPDEAHSASARKAVIDWFISTAITRLNDKRTGVIIVIMQRLHENDLVGHLLETDPNGWVHLDLPAIAQEPQKIQIGDNEFHDRQVGDPLHDAREPLIELDRLKRSMGSAAFSAQYLQRPVPAIGNIVRREWFKFYGTPPVRKPGDLVVQSWDTALKSDQRNNPSVCTTWLVRNKTYYLLDVLSERLEFPELQKRVIDHYQNFQTNMVLIEDSVSGISLQQAMQRVGGINAVGRKPEGDKQMRLHAQTAIIEAGRVVLPTDAPWLAAFLNEVLGFPNARHDDQVDSMSQFLKWAEERLFPSFSYDMGWDDGLGVPSAEAVLGMRSTFW